MEETLQVSATSLTHSRFRFLSHLHIHTSAHYTQTQMDQMCPIAKLGGHEPGDNCMDDIVPVGK